MTSFPIKAYSIVGPKGQPCQKGSTDEGNNCGGLVLFEQTSEDSCTIKYDITGLKQGTKVHPLGSGNKVPSMLHGFHVHLTSDFSNGCISAGPHYNPFNKPHGPVESDERHAGGLGNIEQDENGNSKGEMKDRLIKLTGEYSVIGRSMMVHANEDDLGFGDNSKADEPGPPQDGFVSKITGNAGGRVACGEILLGEPPAEKM